MPARILARWALRAERRWRGQALVLGLEDMQGVPHHQSESVKLSFSASSLCSPMLLLLCICCRQQQPPLPGLCSAAAEGLLLQM